MNQKMKQFSSVIIYSVLLVILCISQEIYAQNNENAESNDELIFAHIVSRKFIFISNL